jgi:hypothetical protein
MTLGNFIAALLNHQIYGAVTAGQKKAIVGPNVSDSLTRASLTELK